MVSVSDSFLNNSPNYLEWQTEEAHFQPMDFMSYIKGIETGGTGSGKGQDEEQEHKQLTCLVQTESAQPPPNQPSALTPRIL